MLGKGAFTLVFTLQGFANEGMTLGVMNFFKKYSSAKVKVNNAVAEEIIDTIGAVVAENK